MVEPPMATDPAEASPGPRGTRRAVLATGIVGGVGLSAAGGYLVGRARPTAKEPTGPAPAVDGDGIVTPNPRQAHASITVHDLAPDVSLPDLLDELDRLRKDLADGARLNGLDPADLTCTYGIGPRLVRDVLGADAPGADELPSWPKEEITQDRRGGDLVVQVCSDDPIVVGLADTAVTEVIAGRGSQRWSQVGFRGALDQGIGRNVLGFHDGVTVPDTPEEQTESVWLNAPLSLQGGTVMVVRVFRIDTSSFTALPAEEQEAVIGRHRDTGAPLSGGTITDDPDLHAKSQTGEYLIDVRAHVRRAHPLPAGAPGLMLRRSYSYHQGPQDQGLIFISFQNDVDSFIRTQARMSQDDALMDHAVATATGTFLILPPPQGSGRLGDPLRD